MSTLVRILLAGTLAVLSAASVRAEIFKSVDKDGNVVFSDQPAAGGEPVQVGPTNSMKAPANGPALSDPVVDTGEAPYYQSVEITSPSDGGTVNNPGGNVLVMFDVSPPLREGDTVRLLVDGVPGGMPADGGLLAPANARGEHSFEVQVLDSAGAVILGSGQIRVTVFRSPTRDRPGRPQRH